MDTKNILGRVNYVKWIITLIIYTAAFAMIIPFLWMVSTSFKIPGDVFNYPIEWIPKTFDFEGYRYVWERAIIGVSFYVFYLNSIKVAVIVLIGTFLSCSLAAYAYTKIRFIGRDTIFLLKLSTMMIPVQVTMVPVFIIYRKLGLIDSHMALWVMSFLGGTFGTFLLRQFFKGIPDSLCESARIDGASHLRIYWNIVIPLSKAALAALMIFTFVGVWNDYETPLLYLRTPSKFTIPIGLKAMSSDVENIHYPGIMAGVVSSVIPILIVFAIGQKYFVQGVALTGVKE